MIRKSIILAAALAIALPLASTAPAFAAPKAPAAKTLPQPQNQEQAMPPYPVLHSGVVKMLTQFKTMLTSEPEVTSRLGQLPTELDKLPVLEKAYIDAKNAGEEAAATKAHDDYVATATKIVELALPLDQGVLPIKMQLTIGFAQLGDVGEKLLKEKDVVALTTEIDNLLAPLMKANEVIGPLHDAAAQATQLRMQQEAERIAKEEFANQVNNYLQGKLAE